SVVAQGCERAADLRIKVLQAFSLADRIVSQSQNTAPGQRACYLLSGGQIFAVQPAVPRCEQNRREGRPSLQRHINIGGDIKLGKALINEFFHAVAFSRKRTYDPRTQSCPFFGKTTERLEDSRTGISLPFSDFGGRPNGRDRLGTLFPLPLGNRRPVVREHVLEPAGGCGFSLAPAGGG